MRKHYLFIALLLICCCTMAQVPGFRGKKCSIIYDIGINHPALVGRSGKVPMLYHNVSVDYVVARAWSVGVKYSFMTYKAAPDKRAFFSDYNNYTNTAGYNLNDYKGRYKQHVVSFIAKKFIVRKGYLAPVGRYIILGCYYQYVQDYFATLTGREDALTGYTTYVIQGRKAVAHYGGVTFGVGRNFIVARRLIFDLSATISGSPAVLINGNSDKQAIYRNMALRNLFQINLGIGALAF